MILKKKDTQIFNVCLTVPKKYRIKLKQKKTDEHKKADSKSG